MTFLVELLYEILSSIIVNQLAEAVGLTKRHENNKRRLISWVSNKRNNTFAKKEILRWGVVKAYDQTISESTKERLVTLFDHGGCISKKNHRDENFGTILSIDIERIFLQIDPILGEIWIDSSIPTRDP